MQNFLDFVPVLRDQGGLPTGSIIGIAVAGVVALLATCAICVVLALLRRRSATASKKRDLRSVASSDVSKVRMHDPHA